MREFVEFPKIGRYNKIMGIVTEKIDGTNAQVQILSSDDPARAALPAPLLHDPLRALCLYAGSRSRYITPEADNFGFAAWVKAHGSELLALGPGRHFGEWWGAGVQRGYGLKEKRFSLFNTSLWNKDTLPACCGVVPVLGIRTLDTLNLDEYMDALATGGSVAAPGFMKPEGVVVFYTGINVYAKKTLDHDGPKSLVA